MAKPSDTKTLDQLFETGTAKIGSVDLSFITQDGGRVVVGFLASDDNGRWLRDTCDEAGLSLLRVMAKAPADFMGKDVQAFLKVFAGHDLCTTAKSISLCGKGTAGTAAIKHAEVFTDPIIVVFDLPGSGPTRTKAALEKAAKTCRAAYLFYDPFIEKLTPQRNHFAGPHIHWLKCFGLQDDTLHRLWRMKLIPTILPAALLDELDCGYFYHLIRSRKDYRFYRTGIEAALVARGKTDLLRRFRAAFRARVEANDPALQFAKLRQTAAENKPQNPDAWAMAGRNDQDQGPQSWPSEPGNVWMLTQNDGALRYISDRWHGVTIGFEERAGVTLAQTASLALGMVSFGHGTQVERNLDRRFAWHVIGPNLSGNGPATGPIAEATLHCEAKHSAHAALPTILAVGHAAPGITAAEVARGTPAYTALLDEVRNGQAALKTWGKDLFVDRLRLSLLSGSPQTPQADAAAHYATVAAAITADLTALTQQDSPAVTVVFQSAGSRSDGRSEVILAEGQFDLDNLTVPAIVPSPTYPWPLMPGTPSTPSAEAALVLDELSMLAVAAFHAGQKWFCPYMRSATLAGRTITVEFTSLAGLHLEGGPHGFHILGAENPPKITKAEVMAGDRVALHLDTDAPATALTLAYAWGHHDPDNTADHTANHGALRDGWEQPSRSLPGQVLHRFALAGRVPIAR